MSPTITDLAAALRANTLPDWLKAVEAAGVPRTDRDELRRAIEHDRSLWSELPDSIASGLLARTLEVAGLARLRAAWLAEVQRAGRPWVRCLHPLPLRPGLVRTLSAGGDVSLEGLVGLRSGAPAPPDAYPRFEKDGWGPVRMRASATTEPVELPCPPEASANAQLARDGRTIIVHGSHDECAGGFVWFVRERGGFLRPRRLEVERKLETSRMVLSVHESADGRALLAQTTGGLVCWSPDGCRTLPIDADSVALSPNGEQVAVRKGQVVQVWSVRETSGEARGPRFPARFSAGGARLVRGTTLHEGTTGAPIARLAATFGRYLEGGPARPWFHVGDDFVINTHSELQVWRAADGQPVEAPDRRFPHWEKLAHGHSGRQFAVLRREEAEVRLHAVPTAEVEAAVTFELARPESIALSPSGRRVVVAQGAEVEVRTWTGELLLRVRHPVPDGDGTKRPRYFDDPSLQFTDEDHVVSHVPADGWRMFRLVEGTSDPVGKPPVGLHHPPSAWKIDAQGRTVFEHEPTGARIALPVSGAWVVHPTRRTILACDDAHVELMTS